jgi:hypothetical protein
MAIQIRRIHVVQFPLFFTASFHLRSKYFNDKLLLKYRVIKKSLYSRKKQTSYFYSMNAHTISRSKWCWLFIYNKCWK